MSELLESLGLPNTTENTLYVDSAIAWMKENTTLNTEAPTSTMKLFILKYTQLLTNHAGVASESISGLSQSFVTGQDLVNQIYELARAILGAGCLKSTVTVFSGEDRWTY